MRIKMSLFIVKWADKQQLIMVNISNDMDEDSYVNI